MVDEVVKIIQKYHFESQAIFMSLHYQSVAYLQHLYPKWWVGYCIYGSIGDIDNSIWDMDIDFLAIEENRASTFSNPKGNISNDSYLYMDGR